jgi:hypothetical protein
MVQKKNNLKKINKYMYWTPRSLSIIFILFLSLMSLDVFGTGLTFWETLLAFLIHNILVFILIIVLYFAWHYEIVGGVAFIIAGALYLGLIAWTALTSRFEWYLLAWAVQISGVAFLIGGLFLYGWIKKR